MPRNPTCILSGRIHVAGEIRWQRSPHYDQHHPGHCRSVSRTMRRAMHEQLLQTASLEATQYRGSSNKMTKKSSKTNNMCIYTQTKQANINTRLYKNQPHVVNKQHVMKNNNYIYTARVTVMHSTKTQCHACIQAKQAQIHMNTNNNNTLTMYEIESSTLTPSSTLTLQLNPINPSSCNSNPSSYYIAGCFATS